MFEFGKAINDGIDRAFKVPLVKTIFSNPLLTAALTTLIIFIIIQYILSSEDEDDPRINLKGSAVIFGIIVGALFIYSRVLLSDISRENENKGVKSMLEGMRDGAADLDQYVPISSDKFAF